MTTQLINPRDFNICVSRLRTFFLNKGFIEVHPQSAQSILAACEDPATISTYHFDNIEWPLPQTGQMWLEHVLLDNPDLKGCFAVTTSYRNEPNPVEGRHQKIFPMFEFESKGNMNDLIDMEKSLLTYLGFNKVRKNNFNIDSYVNDELFWAKKYKKKMLDNVTDSDICVDKCVESGQKRVEKTVGSALAANVGKVIEHTFDFPSGDYKDCLEKYGVDELEHEHEQKLCDEYGPVYFIKNFPLRSSPFWNMKMENGVAKKIDVILHGQETIGSAERSCNKDEMRELFDTISDGGYADTLYTKFGKERVDVEFEEYLDKDFFERYGGGIGITRMIRALKMSNLMEA